MVAYGNKNTMDLDVKWVACAMHKFRFVQCRDDGCFYGRAQKVVCGRNDNEVVRVQGRWRF
jgi:hypothetical protein